jgi:hypothetical protein
MMSRMQCVDMLYRLYMREEKIGLGALSRRLNAAWRARGQKPRIWHWPKSLGVAP